MYTVRDIERVYDESDAPEDYRSVWRRDFARLIHCPSFRRLQGKTQLFPASETDFFRNRLTHSLEVAQIAKSIALKINHLYNLEINTDLVEFSALAHDLGHPPFGHQGEEALDDCMIDNGGYEGNAQTLRILTKIEKKIDTGFLENGKDIRVGLNLCYRTLASILKYNQVIPFRKESREKYRDEKKLDRLRPVKGIYQSEEHLVRKIQNQVAGDNPPSDFKTIECQIMDIADDISNATYDLEDVLKGGFFTVYDFLYAPDNLVDKIRNDIERTFREELIDGANKEVVSSQEIRALLKSMFPFVSAEEGLELKSTEIDDYVQYSSTISYQASKEMAENGYHRVQLTSKLVNDFVSGIEYKPHPTIPALSKVKLRYETRLHVEILKRFTYEVQILSTKLKVAEFRGKDIVKKVFDALSGPHGHELLPKDYRELYRQAGDDRKRVICDFIAGMTDKYLIEFYGRLTSESPETIFKPI